jgi:transcription elongation factor Elf1
MKRPKLLKPKIATGVCSRCRDAVTRLHPILTCRSCGKRCCVHCSTDKRGDQGTCHTCYLKQRNERLARQSPYLKSGVQDIVEQEDRKFTEAVEEVTR